MENSPSNLPEGISHDDIMILTYGIQNCEITKFCYFKSANLW